MKYSSDNIAKKITKLDKSNMLNILSFFPKQCEDALFIGKRVSVPKAYQKKYSNVVFTGLGGSAIGADLISCYISGEIKIPFLVNRDYDLPAFVKKDSLVFAISYSGNTEETLSAYKKAKEKKAKVAVITSGGKLGKIAKENRDLLITIPKGYPPRCALGYSFIPALTALSRIGLIEDRTEHIKRSITLMRKLQKDMFGPELSVKDNIAFKLSEKLYGKIPVIYTSSGMSAVATRWRGQFAENSKVLSSTHVFPEMNHNEIVGWSHPERILRDFIIIILKDKSDHPRVKARMNITESILKKEKFETLNIEGKGTSLLERMFSLVYIGDFVSFYLAILNSADPTPVDRITYLKKELAK